VFRVPGYRSKGSGFDFRRYQIFFMRSSGSGTGSTQPREDNWELFHPLSANLALTSPTSGGRSVGIVRLRTTGHGVCVFYLFLLSVKYEPYQKTLQIRIIDLKEIYILGHVQTFRMTILLMARVLYCWIQRPVVH
jgi:hypothetical protein